MPGTVVNDQTGSAQVIRLENPIQEYAWGSPDALARVLSIPNPSGHPQAELWMGAHPQAPSRVTRGEEEFSLGEFIQNDPQAILGASVAERFDNQLPFLFKVLAAEDPLSIQAHPDLESAAAGFERETLRGLALDSPRRNYKDSNHKPELICALSEFWGLNGFRPIPEILGLFDQLECPPLSALGEKLRRRPTDDGLRDLFTSIMSLGATECTKIVAEVASAAGAMPQDRHEMTWLVRVAALHPNDAGVLCMLLLNLVKLAPGQAMYLPAGQLHSYLHGVGIELMASSDNVLRGGLTSKHIDLEELLHVVRFGQAPVELLEPLPRSPAERVYKTPASEFELSVIELAHELSFDSGERSGVEILLCLDGNAQIELSAGSSETQLAQGQSALIPAAAGPFEVRGTSRLYRAAVPAHS